MSAHESWWAPMDPWRHAEDCFWALMSAHCSMAPGSWVFMASHERTWVLMRAHEHSWEFMIAELLHGITDIKCSLLKGSPRSILPISRSKFHRIIKNWIFSKSTRNGLLKNVQDGISMPIGSREIQITKVDTVLWDTLYFVICNI